MKRSPSAFYLWLLLFGPLQAADATETDWINPSLGDWFVGSNWSGGAVPGYLSEAFIEKGGTALLNSPSGQVHELNVGVLRTYGGNGAGTLLLGSAGRLALTGGIIVGGSPFSGQIGNGTMIVSAGGKVDASGFSSSNMSIADYGPGSVTITDASSHIDLIHGQVQVGDGQQGAGSLKIQNGGELISSYGAIGSNSDSNGSVTVTGANSTWLMSDGIDIGRFGAGTLTISNGGSVRLESNEEPSFESGVGSSAGAIGTVTVTDAGSLWYAEQIFVGGVGQTIRPSALARSIS